tara:strand:- start:1393 stop:1737 length:345 start_codon:yes stop_codon:yes gene_type:complete
MALQKVIEPTPFSLPTVKDTFSSISETPYRKTKKKSTKRNTIKEDLHFIPDDILQKSEEHKKKIDITGIKDKLTDTINEFTGSLDPVKSEVAPSKSMIYLIIGLAVFFMYNKKK